MGEFLKKLNKAAQLLSTEDGEPNTEKKVLEQEDRIRERERERDYEK